MSVINCASIGLLIVALMAVAGCSKESATPAPVSSSNNLVASGEILAKAKGCLVCHGVDKANLGPSYREVAKKYAGDSGAAARLLKKVKEGGGGVWGNPPMPPQTHVSDEDAKALVDWVLSLK